jgi:uncharacterized membrane protein YhaH (DUF805 family)
MNGEGMRPLGHDGRVPLADPSNESWWWVPVAVVATAVPVSVLAVSVLRAATETLPFEGAVLLGVYWAFVVGAWLFSPLAVFYDRQHVEAVSGWLPPAYYFAVFVPVLGSVVAVAYLVQRYQHAGFR